jgi:hypothetical protein
MTLKCRSSDTSNLDMPKEAGKLRHESSSLIRKEKNCMLRLLSSAVRTNLPSSTEENKKQTHTKKEYRPIKMNELKLCLVWSLRSGLDTRICT